MCPTIYGVNGCGTVQEKVGFPALRKMPAQPPTGMVLVDASNVRLVVERQPVPPKPLVL